MQETIEIQKLVKQLVAVQRQDIRKKICSQRDACYILDVSANVFYELLKDPECLIKPSKLRGKYVLESIYKEADRLNGN